MKDTVKCMLESDFGFGTEVYSKNKQILDEMNIPQKMCDDGKERYMYNAKITKIFLGAAMSDEQKAEMHSIISSEVEVIEMRTSDTKYELLSYSNVKGEKDGNQ